MAAAVKTLVSGRNKLVINVTGTFDTADETDTVIVDASTLTGPDGTPPTGIRIDEITWAIGTGFTAVILQWDATTDDLIDNFQGQGYMDYRPYGGKNDPKSTGSTGDILLTTTGGTAGGTYSLLINCTLKD